MQVEEHFVDIIRKEMELDQQHIWIQAQNRKIPPNSQDLFVVVGAVSFKPISSKSEYIHSTDKERQVVYGRATVQVDIMSRSNEARVRREEILMALNSFYSKEIQNKYHFRIFELSESFINLSGLAGGSDINRFSIRIPAMVTEEKIKSTNYYDSFNAKLFVEEKGVDVIEMNNLQNDPETDLQSS
ncbi:MAG: hypothetical protein KBT03_09455 [Bacteroidales bacterium]|nr:hypothetical protein [Candidatus Scybalousia scybalohippi]